MFGPAGGSRSAAAPGGGLPFAGIPPELQRGVDKLLAEEPDHGKPTARFTYRSDDDSGRHLTLRALIFRHWQLGALALLLVTIVSVTNQAGPLLIEYGINHGMLPGHQSVAVIVGVSVIFLAMVAITAAAQRSQVRVTGRLAARVMNDLRVRVFTHLQRLGLDFYTDEKAGVIMTRMTSDIEQLQQLLQDGLAQLVVQALTMVVITVVLFTLNVELALITIALVVPLLTAASIWFRSASARGYDRVRDGIANVLGDLSESLHGVRTVAAYNRQKWNIVQHRNVVGDYRDGEQLHRADQRDLRSRHDDARVPGAGGAAGDRRSDGPRAPAVDRRARRLLPLPQSVLRPDSAARPAVQHLPAGAGRRGQAAVAVLGRPLDARGR